MTAAAAAAAARSQRTNPEDPFWIGRDQMALKVNKRQRLSDEGLESIRDFIDFKDDEIAQAIKNMRTTIPPVAGVPAVIDANGTVVFAAIPPIPARQGIVISTKCHHRLKVASRAWHYYQSIQRSIRSDGMHFSLVLTDFNLKYEAIIKLSKKDKPDVPKITKTSTPLRWIESFNDCLYRTYGIRDCPLSYVIRENDVNESEEEDPLQMNKSYGKSGSVLDEMIKRLRHNHPLFKSDNAAVYSLLEEATRGTIYAPTVKPYARKKDGRQAYKAMKSSHIGEDKWDSMQKENLKFMMNTHWTGKSYSLEKFTGLHRTKYVQLEEASTHINFQLPTQHSRVGYLIDNIKSTDPHLAAALGTIRLNTNDMRSNFETAVAFMLPVCPYTKAIKNKSNDQLA